MSSPSHREKPRSSIGSPSSVPSQRTRLSQSPPPPSRQVAAESPSRPLSTPQSNQNRRNDSSSSYQHNVDQNARRPQNSRISNNDQQSSDSLQPGTNSQELAQSAPSESPTAPHQAEFDDHFRQQEQDDLQFVLDFWKIYDDLLFLSLFTQLGVVARLASSTWFTYFDTVFTTESALFVNLPLNCLSCWLLGLLSSGDSCLQLIVTRFSPPRLQQQHHKEEELADVEDDFGGRSEDGLHDDQSFSGNSPSHRRTRSSSSDDSHDFEAMEGRGMRGRPRRRGKHDKQNKFFRYWQPPVHLNDELRDVQLLALERRIRQSKCLVLFPVSKEDVDVMEHYFDEGFKKSRTEDSEDNDKGKLSPSQDNPEDDDIEGQEAITSYSHDLAFEESIDNTDAHQPTLSRQGVIETTDQGPGRSNTDNDHVDLHGEESAIDINQIVNDVSANVTENVTRLRRANIADGWDVGTTGADMADDIMLGLRFGFCGALSSFSSWNSAMINLIRSGKIGDAFVGYLLGLQLPIIAYRFGQHVAVYIFVWRCRREAKRDERRGYGIQLNTNEDEDEDREMRRIDNSMVRSGSLEMSSLPTQGEEGEDHLTHEQPPNVDSIARNKDPIERQSPSIRAVVTVIFIMAVVTQCTSISFYNEPQNQVVAMSLLFSPLGVLARWRLSKYNAWRPTFPIGTFTCNILACALSGGLGRIMAGNPNEEERLVLVSVINGFGGTLSSVANFIVEILAGIDPILFRIDGAIYALWSIGCAMVVGFLFTASADWADALG